jgi:hypothetical protein
VVIAPTDVAMFPEGGGHLWVYLQWFRGLAELGCDVWWLEHVAPGRDRAPDDRIVADFLRRAETMGFADRVIVCRDDGDGRLRYVNRSAEAAERVLRRADLLLDFRYRTTAAELARFRRTALVDIDPGLLQFWVRHGQIDVQPHDHHFTTGAVAYESRLGGRTVTWLPTRPVVHLPSWPYAGEPVDGAFTTVTNWFGDEWLSDGKGLLIDNNKCTGFMPFIELPRRTSQPLELAICMGDRPSDAEYRRQLEGHGWRVMNAADVAGDPVRYRGYIRSSRGEFSCVKPSCLLFNNGWVSDRTLCYLASGKPAVVQDTGPNPLLPRDEGMFRFSTLDEAAAAVAAVNARYEHHARAAREIVESHFDARDVVARMLDVALA